MMEAPENTRPAFDVAMDRAEITFIETDMNITADGEYVAIHDLNFNRYTGEIDEIGELTIDEIRDIDLGNYYARSYAGTRAMDIKEIASYLRPYREQGGILLEVKVIGEGEEAMQQFLNAAREIRWWCPDQLHDPLL